jgi:O-antigen ligase
MAKRADTPEPESILTTSLGWLTVAVALSLPLYRPWVSLATTAIIVLWLFGGNPTPRIRRLRSHRLTIAVLFFLALNVVSLLWTADLGAGLKYLTKYRYLLLVPMLAGVVKAVYRRSAVTAFEIAAAVSVVLSLGVFVGLFRIGDAHPGNPSPTMAHLDYGLVLATAALLILARVLHSERGASNRVAWTCLALLVVVGLMVNIGRGGHLAFAGGLAVLLVHWARGRSAPQIVGVTLALTVGLFLIWISSPTLRARVGNAGTELHAAIVDHEYESNLGGRIAAVRVAREIFRENPILGTGVGGNMVEFRRIIDTRHPELKPSIYWYRHFHNQYTQIATELGVVGLLSLGWIFWELIRLPRRSRESDAAALVLAAVYLLGFLSEPFFHKQITLVMFGLFAGLISAQDLESIDVAEDPTKVGN